MFKSKIFWCSNCLAMSTRPRISFDKNNVCNACSWSNEKKFINWKLREKELDKILKKFRNKNGSFDCIVPVSGGKDGSYVFYNLKKRGMNPLAVTITPSLPLKIGEKNLRSFVETGVDHISINPNYNALRKIDKLGLEHLGQPYYGWLTAIHTGIYRIANAFNIRLIFYGEDGEVEYGGTTKTKYKPIYNVNYQKKIYLDNSVEKILKKSKLSKKELFFFTYPKKSKKIFLTHWSYFENWNPYRNYILAKEKFGLDEMQDSKADTFTNFAQNDQALYSLHAYLMYLKFGFGRANQDASIEVRRGAMSRQQAINLVRIYDGKFPYQYLDLYLKYYNISKKKFKKILDKFTNKKIFKINNSFEPEKKFEIK